MGLGAFYLFVDFNEQRDELQRLGLESCASFCEDVLHVEHTAMLPGESLLLAEDDFAVRCSYVDYDGDEALAAWRKGPRSTPEEEDVFFQEHCPLLFEGVQNVARYLETVRSGKRPVHM